MIQAGYAEVDITPQNGEDLCGFALRKGPTKAPHAPLKCRFLSLQNQKDNRSFLIGSVDILSLSRETFKEVRKSIGDSAKTRQVGLAATHTHSGPATVTLRHCGRLSRHYMTTLKSNIASAAEEAVNDQHRAVRIVVGSSQSDWAFNRRHNDGPVDHEVVTIGFLDSKGNPVATLVNYACHPVVLGHNNNAISPDYPGYLSTYMATKTGAPCLFLNGACGDLNPVNNHSTEAGEARRAGEAIGAKAFNALNSAVPVESPHLGWFTQKVTIPVHQPECAAELEQRLDSLQERFGLSRNLFTDRIAKDIRLINEGRYPKSVSIELSLLSLGHDLAILFVPGELFSSIGLRIKAMMPHGKIIVSGFSNGSVGYLSDRQGYKDGGYEPYFANFFYDFPEFEPSVEDVVLAGARSLIAKAISADAD